MNDVILERPLPEILGDISLLMRLLNVMLRRERGLAFVSESEIYDGDPWVKFEHLGGDRFIVGTGDAVCQYLEKKGRSRTLD